MLLAVSLLLGVLLIGAVLAVLGAELWPDRGRRLWALFALDATEAPADGDERPGEHPPGTR